GPRRPPAVCDPHAVPGHAAVPATQVRGAAPHRGLEPLRRAARRVPAGSPRAGGAAGGSGVGVEGDVSPGRHRPAAGRRPDPAPAAAGANPRLPLLRLHPRPLLHLPGAPARMKLTIVHPCIGRRVGEPYIRTWQMEPLAAGLLAGLTPADVE